MTHHHHDHEHSHSHAADTPAEMSVEQKMSTLVRHWVDHNISHMQTYQSWAEKAAAASLDDVAARLQETAQLCQRITEELEAALKSLNPPEK